jgi:hypothetical protein
MPETLRGTSRRDKIIYAGHPVPVLAQPEIKGSAPALTEIGAEKHTTGQVTAQNAILFATERKAVKMAKNKKKRTSKTILKQPDIEQSNLLSRTAYLAPLSALRRSC